jgi:hypothetical protein
MRILYFIKRTNFFKCLTLLLFFFNIHLSFSQDLIIRNNQDSINCKILNSDSLNVYVEFVRNGNLIKSFISKSDIQYFEYNYYKNKNRERVVKEGDFPNYFVKLDYSSGIGYLVAKTDNAIPQILKRYVDEMRLGLANDLSFNMNVYKNILIGFRYNTFKTSNYIPYLIEDNIETEFFGINFAENKTLYRNKGFLYGGLTFGKMYYLNNSKIMDELFVLKADSPAYAVYLGLDFLVTNNISLGFHSAFFVASIDEVEVNGIKSKLSLKENLSRFDTMLGLKIYL